MHCSKHQEEMVWIELSPGRKVLRCLTCHTGIVAQEQHNVRDVPFIRLAQNFHRDRAYTAQERRTPPRKPKF